MMTYKILMVSDRCPSCDTIKEYLREKGVLDNYYVVDISTGEGQNLVEELGLKGVPDCVLVDDEKKQIRQCSDEEWMNMLEGK